MKEQATKLEIFRSYLLDRIEECRVGAIGCDLNGRLTFEVMPELQNYTWVIDLGDREKVNVQSTRGSAGSRLTIAEERTNE